MRTPIAFLLLISVFGVVVARTQMNREEAQVHYKAALLPLKENDLLLASQGLRDSAFLDATTDERALCVRSPAER
jgi:hypothetical protein